MGLPRWELAGRETGRGIYHRRWDIQDGNWQLGRREEEFTTGDGKSKMGTGRQGDGKRNLPQEMGHPRWDLAGRETGKRNLPQEMGLPRWELAGRETGKRNLPQEMGHPRWELAGRETGRGI